MSARRTARVYFRVDGSGFHDHLIAVHRGRIMAAGYSIPCLRRGLGKWAKEWRLDFTAPVSTLVGPIAYEEIVGPLR